jgi:hypothetical protein
MPCSGCFPGETPPGVSRQRTAPGQGAACFPGETRSSFQPAAFGLQMRERLDQLVGPSARSGVKPDRDTWGGPLCEDCYPLLGGDGTVRRRGGTRMRRAHHRRAVHPARHHSTDRDHDRSTDSDQAPYPTGARAWPVPVYPTSSAIAFGARSMRAAPTSPCCSGTSIYPLPEVDVGRSIGCSSKTRQMISRQMVVEPKPIEQRPLRYLTTPQVYDCVSVRTVAIGRKSRKPLNASGSKP